jgi:hypothetical protein
MRLSNSPIVNVYLARGIFADKAWKVYGKRLFAPIFEGHFNI